MWNRMFGADSFKAKGTGYIRTTLHQVLEQAECSQLVIGHSVQVLPYCQGCLSSRLPAFLQALRSRLTVYGCAASASADWHARTSTITLCCSGVVACCLTRQPPPAAEDAGLGADGGRQRAVRRASLAAGRGHVLRRLECGPTGDALSQLLPHSTLCSVTALLAWLRGVCKSCLGCTAVTCLGCCC